ncbi:MAG: ferredoxin-type protein NapG [Desulfobulbaceae bacterium]|nr:ferredoxin-type protein NapG [Desulfobulbaceae bacterium]HIJ89523.1 ferredoxin-type protein NapG [Deltaproteobacteria bacterium]
MKEKPETAGPDAERRRFLLNTARTTCGAALVGLGLGLYANRQAVARPVYTTRPPGALPDKKFLAACVRCGQCVRACPYKALRLAKPEEEVATGTPYFIPRRIPCELCEKRPCIRACPTGALDPLLTDIYKARMGLAVLIDRENCLNFLGLRCDVCYRSCPLIDKAITLATLHNQRSGKHTIFQPEVHSKFCTGCGKCEKACVLDKAAIKVLPLDLAKGELGKHYRLGWEEKTKAGHSLIPEQMDLPDRMPEFTSTITPEWKP